MEDSTKPRTAASDFEKDAASDDDRVREDIVASEPEPEPEPETEPEPEAETEPAADHEGEAYGAKVMDGLVTKGARAKDLAELQDRVNKRRSSGRRNTTALLEEILLREELILSKLDELLSRQ